MSKKKVTSISEVSKSFYDFIYGVQRMELMAANKIKDPAERQKERNRILAKEPPQLPLTGCPDSSIECDFLGDFEDE